MTGAGSVVALILMEWGTGWIAAAAWSQSWNVIRRGHFRITAWATLLVSILGVVALRSASSSRVTGDLGVLFVIGAVGFVAMQYVRSNTAGVIAGALAATAGLSALAAASDSIARWPQYLAAVELIAGAVLLGAVTNGMMLGHWYLNQPGLQPWALARLTNLAVAATIASAGLGIGAVHLLAGASTTGAALGLPGFGESFGVGFFVVWAVLITFTGAVVLGARRCIQIRSIQSATGLYYVALLTVGVAEFLVRYLMVNAA